MKDDIAIITPDGPRAVPVTMFGHTPVIYGRPYHWHLSDGRLSMHQGPSAATLADTRAVFLATVPVDQVPDLVPAQALAEATYADVEARRGCGCDTDQVAA